MLVIRDRMQSFLLAAPAPHSNCLIVQPVPLGLGVGWAKFVFCGLRFRRSNSCLEYRSLNTFRSNSFRAYIMYLRLSAKFCSFPLHANSLFCTEKTTLTLLKLAKYELCCEFT